jgi:hypothetical protein
VRNLREVRMEYTMREEWIGAGQASAQERAGVGDNDNCAFNGWP